ncbi:NrsF family protein [Arsukibacterium sp.]|uniref:NrsF family protein n=1 Tax=Arsukibacterium sp. TaxID=1977258 RepID=UPI002FD96E71
MSDNTDLLIEKLVASHRAVTPFSPAPILLLSVMLLSAVAALFVLPLGIRTEWGAAALLKTGTLLLLTLTMLNLTLQLSGPQQVNWRQARGFWLLLLLSIGFLMGFTLQAPALSVSQATGVPSFWGCVSWVGFMGGGALLVLLRMFRRARPAQRQRLALALSCCAALLAASIYSLHCTVDAVSYLLTAYLLAVMLIVLSGWLCSRQLWHW